MSAGLREISREHRNIILLPHFLSQMKNRIASFTQSQKGKDVTMFAYNFILV